ncbi:Covalently-linked cell wall protein [Pleurostoma richardsiae]|uniref:Covalently-linked cell wall protein n=1 Tax=Pleurostoma richardsiae TaxID=41990 RepID=A0AA38REN6_9PEZI|nr:Covalently-linked cell wall protein [Pleurostoma richardsiae]
MKSAFTLLAAIAGTVVAEGVTSKISPDAAAPTGCSASYDGNFEVTVAKVVSKRDFSLKRRAECGGDGILVVSLTDNVLTDSQNRTGYIASNYQFQFDDPPQAGAIYTAGFSLCSNESLALGGSTVFYQCQSGSFWNLYDRSWAAQCEPVEILAIPCGGDDSAAASEVADGQVVATEVVTTTIVKPLSDGQPQVLTTTVAVPMCQISDGQVQVVTTPCASITTTAAATATAVPVSQYSDGQIQVTPVGSAATTAAAVVTTTPAGVAASSGATTESVAANSTVITSVSSATLSASSAAGTSAVAASGAAGVEMSSLAALVVGLVGAIAFL